MNMGQSQSNSNLLKGRRKRGLLKAKVPAPLPGMIKQSGMRMTEDAEEPDADDMIPPPRPRRRKK